MTAYLHATVALVVGVCTSGLYAQTIGSYYNCAYTFQDLGTPPGVPAALGGLIFKDGDPDTLIIGGTANSSGGALYEVPVVRDVDNHVIGFGPASTLFAPAPNIDGGLCYTPNGTLLYSRYNMNHLGQIRASEAATARTDDLYALGFTGSVGAFMIVPEGIPGAGRFKVAPYNSGRWHDAELTPDGNGTFDISEPTNDIFIGGGPEGIVYIEPGASLFPYASILISEYGAGRITSYRVDDNGDPIIDTRREFMTGLSGAEGGTRDPITGDFLFSTFGGGNRVIVIRGFTPDCDIPANINRDCLLDFFDVQLFLQSFASGDPLADFNDDGLYNFFDVQDFLNNFAQGCN